MQQSSDIEILFVSHKSPPATGGMEKQSYELINGVSRYLKTHSIVYNHQESLLVFFIKLNKRIVSLLKAYPTIKVIHFNDGLLAAISTFHTGYEDIRKTATIHGLDIVFPLTYFQKKIIPRFNTFDRIFAVSEATAAAAFERGLNIEKLQVIPNGVDHSTLISRNCDMENIYNKYPRLQKETKYFVTLGRPVKRKGFSWLVEHVISPLEGDFQLVMLGPYSTQKKYKEYLLSLLPPKLKTLTMLFLGFPSDQDTLRKILPLQRSKVVHLGKVPNEDLQLLLKHSSAFLMPNIPVSGDMEGFGLVCLEASLAGSLVIASSLEGITSAVQHKKNGLLLPAQDERAWIAILKNILDMPSDYREQAKEYTQYTQANYSWDKMALTYASTFIVICS